MNKDDKYNKAFYRGYALAIASLIRLYDQPTVALGIMDCDGITIEDFEESDVDELELKCIREVGK